MLTYSKLLFVHAAAGQWEAVAEFIEAGTADGLLHNPLTLNRMLQACIDAGSAAAAALTAVLPVLRSATASVPGPMVFDRESLRMIEALTAKQASGLAPTEVGEEVAAGDWEETFPEGFNSKVLAALWMPETA